MTKHALAVVITKVILAGELGDDAVNTLCLLQHETQNKGQQLHTEVEEVLGTFYQQRLWKTCLRKVFFFSENELQVKLPVLSGAEAKRELLEILCGLRSPIIGETEVVGQFKAFWLELQEREPLFAKRIARDIEDVLTAVKRVRSESLINLGCQSYGSLVRRMVKDFRFVTLVGGGQLAQEIYPWISQHSVQVMVRDPHKVLATWDNIQEVTQFSAKVKGEVMIVAAPVDNHQLQSLLATGEVSKIIDLRGESKLYAEDSDQYLSLHGFFKIFDTEKTTVKTHFVKAMGQVKEIYIDWSRAVANRPMGWEDLCM